MQKSFAAIVGRITSLSPLRVLAEDSGEEFEVSTEQPPQREVGEVVAMRCALVKNGVPGYSLRLAEFCDEG